MDGSGCCEISGFVLFVGLFGVYIDPTTNIHSNIGVVVCCPVYRGKQQTNFLYLWKHGREDVIIGSVAQERVSAMFRECPDACAEDA